jgi:hypothetical protein
MAQAALSSHAPVSLNTSDQVFWTKIVGGVIGMVSLILEDHGDQYLIDRVTIVRGYAELSLMYPNNPAYRRRVSESLFTLWEALRAREDFSSAIQVKSLHDRCRGFDQSGSNAVSALTLYQGMNPVDGRQPGVAETLPTVE